MTSWSEEEAEGILSRYTTQTTELKETPTGSDGIKVAIFQDGVQVGEYTRNYPDIFNTFVPFFQEGQIYALYSPHYTATRLMRLPECEDIGGEEPDTNGFCPTEFYVPYLPKKDLVGKWGFISGCIWGDDSSWKIQFLDLNNASQGILKREEKFGYLEMADRLSLRECVALNRYHPGDSYEKIVFMTQRLYSMAQNRYTAKGYDED